MRSATISSRPEFAVGLLRATSRSDPIGPKGSCAVLTRAKCSWWCFSEHANDSEHVRREVAKAFSQGLAVIPFRTEAVAPNRSLSYFLETVHWLDAITPPLQNHLRTLTEQVKQLLGNDQEAVPAGTEIARLENPLPI